MLIQILQDDAFISSFYQRRNVKNVIVVMCEQALTFWPFVIIQTSHRWGRLFFALLDSIMLERGGSRGSVDVELTPLS